MPFELARVEGGWKIRDEQGKFYSEGAMPRRQALAQMRALYASGADKKEAPAAVPDGVNASGPGGLTGVLGLTGLIGRKKVKQALHSARAFVVFKDAKGDYRWVLRSSNAFKDKDDEIVSTKALEDDVERSEKENEGEYGPIRWWHVLGADLGICDWRMVHGRTLLESGTFKNAEIGRRIKEAADDLQVSIGFNHPPDEPDSDGVFHHIRVFERSLLPAGRAANPFTSVMVLKGEDPMTTKSEKLAALKALGIDPEDILNAAAATEKELDEQGIAYKEGETDKARGKKKAPPVEDVEEEDLVEEEEMEGDEEEEKARDDADADETEFMEDDEEEIPVIGNMAVKEYGDMLAKSIKEALTEALEKALAPIAEKMHSHDSKEGAVQAAAVAAEKKKEVAERTALKEALAQQSQALKEAQDTLAKTEKEIKRLSGRLAELEGETPRAMKGHRASQDDSTVITEEEMAAMKEAGDLPQSDPMVQDFLGGFLGFKGN